MINYKHAFLCPPFLVDLNAKVLKFQVVNQQVPTHDPDTFLVVPKRRDSRSGSSSEIANEDLYGVVRGKCNECGLCEVYMTTANGKNAPVPPKLSTAI